MTETAHRAATPAYRTILVPLDGSQLALDAVPTARALAERFGGAVHTVTVTTSAREADRARAAAADALGIDPDDAQMHVANDTDVVGAIRGRAATLDRCLLCLSTHGRGRVAGTFVGSVARDVVEQGHEPAIAVGPSVAGHDARESTAPPLESDRLVACVDGHEASEGILPTAAAWAHALDMKLTIVTVAEPSPPPVRIGASWHRAHGPNEDADEYVRRLVDRWSMEAPGVDGHVVYDPIGPASGMNDYLAARPAGLIAVSSHLRGGIDHLVLGSAAAEIIHAATAPVLVVPIVSTSRT